MFFGIQLALPWIFYSALPCIALFLWYKIAYKKQVVYTFPLTTYFKETYKGHAARWVLYVSPVLQTLVLLLLALVLAQPRTVDVRSKINVEGIDMMVVLDVSGSMQICDDENDQRSRLVVAKQEAIKFIEKRIDDPIGLVIFAHGAVSRCPLTLDKKILKEILQDIDIGVIDPSGTVLSLGMMMGANRLKNSQSTNKIMIVLTDGAPSSEDVPIEHAISIAKKLGIKIYTIGIGYDGVRYITDPFRGVQVVPGVNKELLSTIAEQTGGRYFEAKQPQDMKKIYETIDALEKTEYQTHIFTKYNDLYQFFLGGALLLLLVELISSLLWFVV
jgi:Ca-activated chloride channel family protein